MGVLLLALMESGGAAAWLVHSLGVTFVTARCLHARAFWKERKWMLGRVGGTALSFGTILTASTYLIVKNGKKFADKLSACTAGGCGSCGSA